MRTGLSRIGILALIAVVAGCGAQPPASVAPSTSPAGVASAAAIASATPSAPAPGSASPSATGSALPTPTDAPTPAPSPTASLTPPAALSRFASAVHNGIRLRVELQRNPLPAGELSWVKVTASNLGSDVVTWFHDGCARLAGVSGVRRNVWPAGREQTGNAAIFKAMATVGDPGGRAAVDAWMAFEPKESVGRGGYGCADIGITDTIAAGKSRSQTFWWDGRSGVGLPLPAGPLTLQVFGEFYWRGTTEPANIVSDATQFRFELKSWVVGGRDGLLSPGQAVDAALAEPAFAAAIAPLQLQSGMGEFAWYHPDTNRWEIGYLFWNDPPQERLLGVVVDGSTGAVVGKLDRPWDQATDPWP